MKTYRFVSLVMLAAAALSACASGGMTIHVIEHANTDTIVDIGPTSDTVGDVLAFANPVFDEANQKEVGTDTGYCVRTIVGEAWECFWTVYLADGQITVAGPFSDTKDSVLAITGGTGAYSRARGQMKLHALSATEFDFIYELTR